MVSTQVEEAEKMDSLYRRIKNYEYRAELARDRSLFTVKQEARRLLGEACYRDNTVISEMKEGRKLEEIAAEVVAQRKYALKFSRGQRERYNQMIGDLTVITEWAQHLHRSSWLSPQELEGGVLLGVGAALALSGCMMASSSREALSSLNIFLTLGTVSAYAIIGSNIRYLPYGHPRYVRPRMFEEIKHIDNTLREEVKP